MNDDMPLFHYSFLKSNESMQPFHVNMENYFKSYVFCNLNKPISVNSAITPIGLMTLTNVRVDFAASGSLCNNYLNINITNSRLDNIAIRCIIQSEGPSDN